MMTVITKHPVFLLLCLQLACHSPQTGCTDPLAINYDSSAEEDDSSCNYDTIFISPEWSLELDAQLDETSGLIMWDGALVTLNDDSDTRLYLLDTTTGEIIGDYNLEGVVNQDWEEISQDDEYIFVGDVGNNLGNRMDLHILRIDKSSLKSGSASIDTIWFSYSDQQNFDPAGSQQTEFDCEAFVVSSDSIYLFTKQWLSGQTTRYSLSKFPGRYVAQKSGVFDTNGQVTGATFLESKSLLVLSGYTGLSQPFLYLFYNYQGNDFFSGSHKRVNISLPFHQVEAVTTSNGTGFYITNESYSAGQLIYIPNKLHFIDLSDSFNDIMNDL